MNITQKAAQQSFKQAQRRARSGSPTKRNRRSVLPPLLEGDLSLLRSEVSKEFQEEEEEEEEGNDERADKEDKPTVTKEEGNNNNDNVVAQSFAVEDPSVTLTVGGKDKEGRTDVESSDELTDINTDSESETSDSDIEVNSANSGTKGGLWLKSSSATKDEGPLKLGYDLSDDDDDKPKPKTLQERFKEMEAARSEEEKAIRSRLRVFIVTCISYKDDRIKPLHVSVQNDGEAIYDIFSNDYYSKLDKGQVIYLKDPTLDEFNKGMEKFSLECDDQSEVIVYIATQTGRINRGFTSKGSYIFFKNSVFGSKSDIVKTSGSVSQLSKSLAAIAGKNKTVMLDVTHIKKPRSSVAALKQNVINSKTFRVYDDFYSIIHSSCPGWVVIGACDLSLEMQERSLHSKTSGFFGGQLIQALKGETFRVGDKVTSLAPSWKFVKRTMVDLSKDLKETQTPVIYGTISPSAVLAMLPSAPPAISTHPVMVSVTTTNITIEWKPLDFTGQFPVECYELQYRGVMRGEARKWRAANSSIEELSYRLPNLLPGLSYRFRVCARNKFGTSIASPPSPAYKVLEPPKEPTYRDLIEAAQTKGAGGMVKLMRDYKLYGDIQSQCIKCLVAYAVRREIGLLAAKEVVALTLTAVKFFRWNVQLQLESLYLLGYIVSQYEKEGLQKDFIKAKGPECINEAQSLFKNEESIQLTILWFRRTVKM